MSLRSFPPTWLIGWITLPVLIYCVGSIIPLAIIFFPVLLMAAQWYALKGHSGNAHPGYWWATFPLILLLIYYIPDIELKGLKGNRIAGLMLAFYMSQCVAEVILFAMFRTWRWGWYAGSNLMAYCCWVVVLRMDHYDFDIEDTSTTRPYLIIPTLALLTNTLTGYGLLKATEKG